MHERYCIVIKKKSLQNRLPYSLVSITRRTPRHKNKAIIRSSSHPSRESLPFDSKLVAVVVVIGLRATSHLSVRLTAMHVTVNEVSSHLCKILTLIMVKTCLQTGQRWYRIARRPVVTCFNSGKGSESSKSVLKSPKAHSFSA